MRTTESAIRTLDTFLESLELLPAAASPNAIEPRVLQPFELGFLIETSIPTRISTAEVIQSIGDHQVNR